MKYLNGIFATALNPLLGGEEVKCILGKERSLAGDSSKAAAGHRLALWLADNLNLSNL